MSCPTTPIGEPSRTSTARDWVKALSLFRQPRTARAIVELAITVLPLVGAWAAMALAFSSGRPWLAWALLFPAGGLVVRLFLIQHDCGHGAFFPTRAVNDWTGRLIGVVTLTPYEYWRRTHAIHHASSGNLSARGIGDIDVLTTREYAARSAWGRFRYRLYRHPAVMFGLGPLFLFALQYRFPVGLTNRWRPWLSTMGTNAAIGIAAAILIWLVGAKVFLAVQIPITVVAASVGVWLFYVQHQFEDTHWREGTAWNVHDAALHGSSHYDLPPVLRWFTANVGIHHIHHLVSRIPYYRLGEVLRAHPELRAVGRLTLMQSFACTRLVLWDEDRNRLIAFADVDRAPESNLLSDNQDPLHRAA